MTDSDFKLEYYCLFPSYYIHSSSGDSEEIFLSGRCAAFVYNVSYTLVYIRQFDSFHAGNPSNFVSVKLASLL